jgi:hypothetical protein
MYNKDDPDCEYSSLYTYFLSPIGFWVVSDATFYFGHRFWHNKWLYEKSHYHHHSCRPTTSFAGNVRCAPIKPTNTNEHQQTPTNTNKELPSCGPRAWHGPLFFSNR